MNQHLYILTILLFSLSNLAQAQHSVQASCNTSISNSHFFKTFTCGVTVNAGEDIYLCDGDLPVQLNGSIIGTATGYSWMADPNLDDPSILNPMVNAAGTYTLTGQGLELNLIENGDFEQGDMGFDSDYVPGNFGAGNYLIAETPEDYISFFSDCSDHTSGSGNMMIVDGSTSSDDNIWCQTVTVDPNTDYTFSFWATMVGSAPIPELFVTIDGVGLGDTMSIPTDTCSWNEISHTWNSQSNTSVEICIGNMTIFSFGNDFAIDDISLSTVCETTDEVEVFILTAEAIASDATIPCDGDCIQLDGGGSTTGADVSYEWTAISGGAIQDPTTLTPTVCETGTYQLKVIHTDPNNNFICADSITVTVDLGTPDPMVPTFDGEDEVCEGTTEIYSITSTDSNTSTYTWQVTGGTISTGQGSDEIEVDWDGTTPGEVCVLAENICGQSIQECLDITINAVPTIPDISGPLNICSDPLATYATTTTTGINTFNWTVPTGVVIDSGEGTATIDVDWGTVQGGDICLEIINDCGIESDCITVVFGNVQVDINSSDPLCTDDANGFIKVTPLSGTAPYMYMWDGGEMVDSIFGLVANTYTVTVTDDEGCSAIEMITLTNPSALDLTLTESEISCYNECDGSISSVVSGGTSPYSYEWSDGTTLDELSNLCEGTYTVTIIDANDCTIEDQITLTNPPEITASISQDATICEGEQVDIEFTFSGVGPYDIELSDGSIFTNVMTGDVESISPTSTTTISITSFSDLGQSGCNGNSTSSILITVNELPPLPIIDGTDNLCEGTTTTYCMTNIANINTFDWSVPTDASFTGQGTDCIEVDWTGSAGGDICVEATNDCGSEQACLNVTVNENPSSSFSVDPVICVDSTSTITYTGSATSSTIFNWDFGGGTVISGSGSGPYEIQWTTGGDQTVTLTVEENGCTSTLSSEIIDIDEPIPAPIINCTSTTNSIVFTWDDVPGATSYQVNDLSGTGGMVIGNMYSVTGLTNGQMVTIEVVVMGNSSCGNTTVEATCQADDCPNVTVDIMHVDPICLDNSLTPFDLSATITGGTTGISTWTGDGITDATNGTFDPVIAGLGIHDITLTYEENGCPYVDVLTIEIFATPTADFSVDGNICITETSTITYDGNATSAANFIWDFDSGNIDSGNGSGPYEINWLDSGMYNITLTVEENGCTSTAFSQTVQVDAGLIAPIINCNSTTNSVTFTWDDVAGATNYLITDISGPAGTLNGNSYEVTGLTTGEEVTIELTIEGGGTCGFITVPASCSAENCPNVTVMVDPVSSTCFSSSLTTYDLSVTISGDNGGTSNWSGDGIIDATQGTFDPQIAGAGNHVITFTYEESGCEFTDNITVEIFATPTANFSIDGNICITENATITYEGNATSAASFIWDFDSGTIISGNGSGPYELSWIDSGIYNITLTVEEDGCTSTAFSQTIQVDAELIAPTINCNSTTNSVIFSWDDVAGATNYVITDISGPAGTLNGNSYEVTGLATGEEVTIELTIEGGGACGDIIVPTSCFAQNCPNVTVMIDPVSSTCFTSSLTPYDLSVAISGDNGGTSTWSGDGITDAIQGTFDPQIAGAGNHVITYTYEESGCEFTDNITIEIFGTPTADFSIEDNICITDNATITYEGNATSAASFIWNFDGANIISGNGSGPYELSWIDSGVYNITLTVEENNCTSTAFSQSIQVDTLLFTPNISCNSTTNSIIFSWDDVAGTSSYMINDISGPAGVINGNSYEVTGLAIGQQVDIELIVTGNTACGDIIVPMTCFAQNCPVIMVEADPVNAMCFSSNLVAFDLTGTVTGGDNMGVVTWSGDGITDAINGTFDPQTAGEGNHNITMSYEQDGCTFTDIVVIEIFGTPTADFTVDANICLTENATINYQGTGTSAASFIWDFNGGTIISGNGSGPYEINWPDSGIYNIVLTVEENGCISQSFSQMVQMDAPLLPPAVNCTSTTQSVIFTWDDVAGTSNYSVTDISGPMGVLNGNSYEVTGLAIGQTVDIELTIEGATACGNITIPVSCSADNCPPISVAIDPISSICLSNDVLPFDLNAVVNGGNNLGISNWSGQGITDTIQGTFDPQIAGGGTHNITFTYEQDNCTYTDVIAIEIFAIPTSTFDVDGVICVTGSSIVTYQGTATGFANYIWDFDGGTILSGSGAGPYEISWLDSGLYNITLTVEENGCISSMSNQLVQVDAELQALNISCSSTTNSIIFSWDDVPGADNYQVNEILGTGGIQNGNSYKFTNLTPGQQVTIEVVATGSSICGSTSLEQSCSTDNCPSITLAIDPITDICLDANSPVIPLNVIVGGSDGSGMGSWMGAGITNTEFNPQVAGEGIHELTYSFTELQCDFSESIFVNVVLQPEANAGPVGHLDCNQTTIILDGTISSAFANPTWTTDVGNFVSGDNTLTPTIDLPGTYYLLLENNGCSAIDSLVITQNIIAPIADAGLEKLITCNQPCVVLGGANTSTGNSISYAWTGPNSFSSSEINPEVCEPGQYSLTVLDSINGCFSVVSNVIISEETTDPIANIESIGNLDCNTTSLVLDGTTSSGGPNFDYQWSTDNGIIPNAENATYEAFIEGNYYLEVLNTFTGCVSYDTVFVNDIVSYPIAEIATPEMLTCDTLLVELNGSGSSISSTMVYNWTGPIGGIQSGNNTNTIMVNLPGQYELSVLDMTNGCETSTSMTVLQNIVTPSADAGQDIELDCNDITAMLGSENTSSGNSFEYTWTSSNPSSTISDASIINPIITGLGTYTLMVENIDNGCTAMDEIVISQSPDIPQVINFESFDPPCHGDTNGSISITSVEGGDGPYLYSLNGNPFSSNNFYTNLEPADYEITIQDANGCELSTNLTLTEPDSLSINLGGNVTLELGDSIILNPTTTGIFDTIMWETSIPYSNCDDNSPCWNPTLTPTSQVNVIATIMDENGCSDEDQMLIFVEKNRYVYIPNAFSPEGHPDNQMFMIYAGKGVEKVHTFQIFGRWGEKIFEKNDFVPNDASYGWDGSFNGKRLDPGVFVYFAEIEFSDGLKIIYKGDVTLMR